MVIIGATSAAAHTADVASAATRDARFLVFHVCEELDVLVADMGEGVIGFGAEGRATHAICSGRASVAVGVVGIDVVAGEMSGRGSFMGVRLGGVEVVRSLRGYEWL